jgi:hypothetical protein
MKQVRYLAGAAGLAPLTFAAAMAPGAAHDVQAVTAKTVATRYAAPDAVCYGQTLAQKSAAYSLEQFWWTSAGDGFTCIGTVEFKEYRDVATGLDMRTRIWQSGVLYWSQFHTGHFSKAGDVVSFSSTVRAYFDAPHAKLVCTAAVKQSDKNDVVAGPLCRSVP